ncbi:MAG: elongation factor P-like protein YeiP [Gammaproteobacteria bacterium]
MRANELKRGHVVEIDGATYVVKEVQVKSPSSRSGNTLYKVEYRNVVTKQKFEQTYRGEDLVQEVEFTRRPIQLLYQESASCTFMDKESYEQYTFDNEAIEAELPYLVDGLDGIYALVANETLLGIELPATVEMDIVECAPGIKGASASARTKPATLTTGLVVQVPEYLAPGERIKVNTATGEFISRA